MEAARSRAAQAGLESLMGGAEMPPEMTEGALPGGEIPGAEGAPGEDLEGALGAVEASIAQAPPEIGEEARSHIAALRELASKVEAVSPEEAPPGGPEGAGPPEIPTEAGGI